ncbi:DNA repair protein radc [Rubidibacter lacunae KORDI 51-2]|uniref:DNA repair protein radc n=1 Tax=Rubidibacter lacunae KORDI 51-2 TaxID=582515 RepID=U5DKU8_9CHRO|nr:DNA repair protein RadC [Rubidibacter lacunae]ERN41184.1 DNA repair protein radc [Rubidibacter lacunae KORDI 51-2]
MSYSVRIADLPTHERPRERLLDVGAANLATAELLAILLGTGQGRGKLSAVGLGQYVLSELSRHQREPLDVLRDVTPAELMSIPGIGPAKATTILAAVELGKRSFRSRLEVRALVDSPQAAASALSADLMWQSRERFALLLLDETNRLRGTQVLTVGTDTATLSSPRDIFRTAIVQRATRTIVAHNHPTGNLEPSTNDLYLTRQLLQGAQLLELPLLDHLILGNGDFRSLRETTDLWQQFPQGDMG